MAAAMDNVVAGAEPRGKALQVAHIATVDKDPMCRLNVAVGLTHPGRETGETLVEADRAARSPSPPSR